MCKKSFILFYMAGTSMYDCRLVCKVFTYLCIYVFYCCAHVFKFWMLYLWLAQLPSGLKSSLKQDQRQFKKCVFILKNKYAHLLVEWIYVLLWMHLLLVLRCCWCTQFVILNLLLKKFKLLPPKINFSTRKVIYPS